MRKPQKKSAADEPGPCRTKSERLAEELLADAENPRENDFRRILEDILFAAGVLPSAEAGLLTNLENLAVSGDGSVPEIAASPNGKPVCACRSGGTHDCGCPRSHTSPTAQRSYDAAHDRFVFGDRYHHLVATQNGHDFPLLIVLPGGNESDFTLSLTAFDRLLKTAWENGAEISADYFMGDGHHDAAAHHRYFAEKGGGPVIPLSEASAKTYPHLPGKDDIRLGEDGTPLCPGGKPVRHHCFDRKRCTHVHACPVRRGTHRGGKHVYVTHTGECPPGKDCAPDSPPRTLCPHKISGRSPALSPAAAEHTEI